jgi:ubiquinone/menaquinone biosynthesis C-methylase UbiE
MSFGDVYEYDRIAEEVFTPAFPVIAAQIHKIYGKDDGFCLDMGSGGGHLGIALANITKMKIVLLDNKPDALQLAQKRINNLRLSSRISTFLGDATEILVPNDMYDLVISRGSLWFWSDQQKGLAEAYRVLKPGGMAYIGGGFGNGEVRELIGKKMKEYDSKDKQFQKRIHEDNQPEKYKLMLEAIGIRNSEIINGDGGFWNIFWK